MIANGMISPKFQMRANAGIAATSLESIVVVQ